MMNTTDDHKDRAESHPVFPESSSLIVLLALFCAAGVIGILSIVMGNTETSDLGKSGQKPYGPEDFPDIVWDPIARDPLPVIASGSDVADFHAPPPPFSEDIFPCSQCHNPEDLPPDPTPRALSMHDNIRIEHGPKERWCFDCHNPDDRDKLRLANGALVGFDESFRLCGQCHGTIYRDWRLGIHGRRTGYWNGAKRYLLCAHCHNPHKPKFQPLEPLPPPVRPEFLRQ